MTSCFSLITVPCPDVFLGWSLRESLAQAIWKFRTPYLLPTLLLFLLLSRISKNTSVSICVSRNKDGLVCVIPVKVSNFYVWIFYSSLCSKLGNLSLFISSFSFCFIFWLIKLIFLLLSWICYLSVNWPNFISFDCLFFRSNFLFWIFLLFQFWNKLIEFSIHALSTFSILQRIHWIFYFQILRFFFYSRVN